jgi:hypothetical protein
MLGRVERYWPRACCPTWRVSASPAPGRLPAATAPAGAGSLGQGTVRPFETLLLGILDLQLGQLFFGLSLLGDPRGLTALGGGQCGLRRLQALGLGLTGLFCGARSAGPRAPSGGAGGSLSAARPPAPGLPPGSPTRFCRHAGPPLTPAVRRCGCAARRWRPGSPTGCGRSCAQIPPLDRPGWCWRSAGEKDLHPRAGDRLRWTNRLPGRSTAG